MTTSALPTARLRAVVADASSARRSAHPRGEDRPALRRVGRRRLGGRRGRPAPARHRRRRRRPRRAAAARARPADPSVRHRAGGSRRSARCRWRAPRQRIVAEGAHGIPALAHEECLAGFAAWGATAYPVPLSWGATFDPELIERMAARIGADMRVGRRAPGPRPGARRGARCPLGPRRGDHRRGPVPGRHDRHRRTCAGWSRPASSRPSSTSSATRPRKAGRNLAPVSVGPRELRRRAAAAVRDGDARGRPAVGDERVHRHRRRAVRGRRRACSPGCCATPGASTAPSSPTTSPSRSSRCCTASPAPGARPPPPR